MTEEMLAKIEYALGLIAAGDKAGVDLLYVHMGRVMLFIARSVVGKDGAEDVVQESFLKIVKGISHYRRGTNGYAWVCRIVRNTALNYLKAAKRSAGADIDECGFLSDGTNLEEKSAAKLTVEKLLASLPPEQRRMVWLKYFFDMTVREIAKEVGRSKSYVAKAIKTAEEKMRSMLK